MRGIPTEIPDLGAADQKPRQNPGFTPGADFGTEDYYVWSRCDGSASLRDIILMTGFGTDKAIGILSKLCRLGAVSLPEARPIAVPAARASAPGGVDLSRGRVSRPPLQSAAQPETPQGISRSIELGALNAEEEAALAGPFEVSDRDRRRILELRRRLGQVSHFELLGLSTDADKKSLKRAYFRLSKEFHPDRFYGKELGPFGPWLRQVFEAVNEAFEVLGDNHRRVEYEALLRGETVGQSDQPQTREEHADSLFQEACGNELRGDAKQALRLFAAAVRMRPDPRYFRRAAMCAAMAGELSQAEEYAKKGAELRAHDPSYLRVLADVYRAGERFADARETLQRALALDTENDILFSELASDLAAVDEAIAEKAAEES